MKLSPARLRHQLLAEQGRHQGADAGPVPNPGWKAQTDFHPSEQFVIIKLNIQNYFKYIYSY
jgi:hypothetical protein